MPHKRAKRSTREQNRKQSGHDNAPAKSALHNEAIPKGAARVLNAWQVQEEYKKKRKLGESGDDGGVSRKNSKRQKLETEKESEGRGGKKVDMRIQPGESLAHFNRRVEDSLRPVVRDAMQTSAATERKARKEEELEKANKKKSASSNKAESKESDEGLTKSTRPSSKSQTSHIADEDEHHRPNSLPETQSHTTKRNGPTDFTSFSASAPRRLNDIVQAPPELKKLPRGAKPRQAAQSGTGTKTLKEGVHSMAQKVMLEGERERVIKAYRELKKRNAGE